MSDAGERAQVSVTSIPPAWKSFPLGLKYSHRTRPPDPGRQAEEQRKGGRGNGFLAQRMGSREGSPWYKEPGAGKGGTAVTWTYQYTTRTASAIAARRIPAQRKDPTLEQQGPRALRVGPCAEPTNSGVRANQVRGGSWVARGPRFWSTAGSVATGATLNARLHIVLLISGVVATDGVPGTSNLRAPLCPLSMP